MDRYLMLKNANVPQMAQLLCNMITDMPFDDLPEACNYCPATAYCKPGHNGMVDWLTEEQK